MERKYQIVSALNYNKCFEVVSFAKSVQLMDSNPNNSNQLFYLIDNIATKSIISVNGNLSLKSSKEKQLEASESQNTDNEKWIFL
jgi:aspartyl/asparaginyl-tRNA synthetase